MMSKRYGLIVAALLVVAVAVAGVGVALASPSNGKPVTPGPIHVVLGPEAHIQFFDFANNGLTLGDRLASVGPMFDATQTKHMGTAYADCWVGGKVLADETPYVCDYVLDFGKGEIMTHGLDPHGASDVFFAITGGTGVFEGASGQAEYIDTDVTDVYINLG
jgi:hypothetical protein